MICSNVIEIGVIGAKVVEKFYRNGCNSSMSLCQSGYFQKKVYLKQVNDTDMSAR